MHSSSSSISNLAVGDPLTVTSTELGEGLCSGRVYLGYNTLTWTKLAVKVFDNDERDAARREAKFLRAASAHPNLVHLVAIREEEEHSSLFLEFCGGGDLLSLAIVEPRFVHLRARRFFRQLVSGLQYLHSACKIAHRDLKLENILLDTYHSQVVIADFGCCEYLRNEPFKYYDAALTYAAPELVLSSPYRGEPADVWALGVILYAMLWSVFPFDADDQNALRQQIVLEDPLLLAGEDTDGNLISLLRSMLEKDPMQRATLAQIRRSPWVFDRDRYGFALAA